MPRGIALERFHGGNGKNMEIVGDILLLTLLAYLLAGAAFALRFVIVVAGRVNERARFGSPFFRMVLIPGAILLWPWLWQRESVFSNADEPEREERSQ